MDIRVIGKYTNLLIKRPWRILHALNPRRIRFMINFLLEPTQFTFVNSIVNINRNDFNELSSEVAVESDFFQRLLGRYKTVRGYAMDNYQEWPIVLYVILRVVKPDNIIETGVFDGYSTSFILKALHENKKGRLYSIDLPAYSQIGASTDDMVQSVLPPGHKPGWLVSDDYGDKWELILGDSKAILPQLILDIPKIDVFIHDSLHTYDHMLWEYDTAWPSIGPGGLLASDDVFWNKAFKTFCAKKGIKGNTKHGFGIVKKND